MADFDDEIRALLTSEMEDISLSQSRKQSINNQLMKKLRRRQKKMPFASLRTFWNSTYEINLSAVVAVCLVFALTPALYFKTILDFPVIASGEDITYVERVINLPDGSIRIEIEERFGN